MISIIISIVLGLVSVVQGQECHDPCWMIAQKGVVSYSEAMACYNNFRLTKSVQEGTTQSLNRGLSMYWDQDTKGEIYDRKTRVTVSVERYLESMRNAEFDHEWKFQHGLHQFFLNFNDTSMKYKPSCFSEFKFTLPFSLTIEHDHNREFVKNVPIEPSPLIPYEWNKVDEEWFHLYSSEVIKIDGVDSLIAISRFSNHQVGRTLDLNTKINYAMTRIVFNNGKWDRLPGLFSMREVPPLKDHIEMEFLGKNGTVKVNIPFFVIIPDHFKDSESFYKNYCLAPNHQIDPNTIITEKCNKVDKIDIPSSKVVGPGQFNEVRRITKDTIALAIAGLDTLFKKEWERDLYNTLKVFKKKSPKNIILDLVNNSGENVCWVYYLMEFLFGNKPDHFPTEILNIKNLSNQWDLTKFNDINGNTINNQTQFINDPSYTKLNSHRTPLSTDNCPTNFLSNLTESKSFTGKLAVVTNGICHGSCSLLVNLLQYHQPITFMVGGISKNTSNSSFNPPISSNPYISTYSLTTTSSSPHHQYSLPTRANLKFSSRRIYSSHSPHPPLARTTRPADYHLPNLPRKFLDTTRFWDQITSTIEDKPISKLEFQNADCEHPMYDTYCK